VQIVDRFGTTYAVKRWPLGNGARVYYVLSLAGDAVVARAVLRWSDAASPKSWFTTGPIAVVGSRRPCTVRSRPISACRWFRAGYYLGRGKRSGLAADEAYAVAQLRARTAVYASCGLRERSSAFFILHFKTSNGGIDGAMMKGSSTPSAHSTEGSLRADDGGVRLEHLQIGSPDGRC